MERASRKAWKAVALHVGARAAYVLAVGGLAWVAVPEPISEWQPQRRAAWGLAALIGWIWVVAIAAVVRWELAERARRRGRGGGGPKP